MAGDHCLVGGQVLRWMQPDDPRHARELLNGGAKRLGKLKSGALGGRRQHCHRPVVTIPSLRRTSSDGLGKSRFNRGHPATITLEGASPASMSFARSSSPQQRM